MKLKCQWGYGPLKAIGKHLFLSLPASGVCQKLLALLGLWQYTPISNSVFTSLFSLSVCLHLQIFLSLKLYQSLDIGSTLIWHDLILI